MHMRIRCFLSLNENIQIHYNMLKIVLFEECYTSAVEKQSRNSRAKCFMEAGARVTDYFFTSLFHLTLRTKCLFAASGIKTEISFHF